MREKKSFPMNTIVFTRNAMAASLEYRRKKSTSTINDLYIFFFLHFQNNLSDSFEKDCKTPYT